MHRRYRFAPRAALLAAVAGLTVETSTTHAQVVSGRSIERDSSVVRGDSESVQELSRERYEEWVRRRVESWETRPVEMVLGREWRIAAEGRDMLDALRRTDLPVAGWEPHPRFSGRICARIWSGAPCTTVSYMTYDRSGDLLEVPPSEIEAVIWIGPVAASANSVPRMAWDEQLAGERVILFSRGYLSGER